MIVIFQRFKEQLKQLADQRNWIGKQIKKNPLGSLLFFMFLYSFARMLIVTWSADNFGFRKQTLWDWMGLLIVPAVLAFGVWWLNKQEQENEQDIAKKQREEDRVLANDRQNHNILGTYLDRMTELLLEQRSHLSEDDHPARIIARTRTLNVLRHFKDDAVRRRQVLYFLNKSQLSAPSLNNRNSQEKVDFKEGVAIFREIDLSRIHFNGDRLHNIDFTNANLENASFMSAEFHNVQMFGTGLSKSNLQKTKIVECILIEAQLDEAQLDESEFENVDLRGANLRGADLYKTLFKSADLSGADLNGASLREADLRGTHLVETDLGNSDMSGVKLIGATMMHPNLVGAILDDSSEIDPKWRTAWSIVNRTLASKDLRGQDLSHTNLNNADLNNINLSKANLSGAKLNGADLSNVDFTLTTFNDMEIDDETIISSKWRLVWELVNRKKVEDDLLREFALLTPELSKEPRYRDLSYQDLSGAQLGKTDLTHARLIGTDLRGADISETNLAGADLRGAFLTDASVPNNLSQQVYSLAGAVMPDGFVFQSNQIFVEEGLRLMEMMYGDDNAI